MATCMNSQGPNALQSMHPVVSVGLFLKATTISDSQSSSGPSVCMTGCSTASDALLTLDLWTAGTWWLGGTALGWPENIVALVWPLVNSFHSHNKQPQEDYPYCLRADHGRRGTGSGYSFHSHCPLTGKLQVAIALLKWKRSLLKF